MAFDEQRYKEIKTFMTHSLNHINFMLVEQYKNDPFGWAATFLPLISDCVHREDYEAAKAGTDAIRHFLNRFLEKGKKIKPRQMLNLPKFKAIKIHGIICYADPNDPYGLSSGGAEII